MSKMNTISQSAEKFQLTRTFPPVRNILENEQKCVGCGGRATRTNNTLCQACWNDAECFEDNGE